MNEPSEFIKAIIEEYQKDGGLVGEERNIAKLFITAISKDLLTDYRIHGIIISQSSAGKSTLAKTITEPFKDDVRHYTRFTGAGLDRNEESLDGKILFDMENEIVKGCLLTHDGKIIHEMTKKSIEGDK